MKRTTIFLSEDLNRLLQEAVRRTRRPQSELLREALSEYLSRHQRPHPKSIGMADEGDESVTSVNVKDWIREKWQSNEPPASNKGRKASSEC